MSRDVKLSFIHRSTNNLDTTTFLNQFWTPHTSDVNKDWTPKDQDKDQTHKDQDKDED